MLNEYITDLLNDSDAGRQFWCWFAVHYYGHRSRDASVAMSSVFSSRLPKTSNQATIPAFVQVLLLCYLQPRCALLRATGSILFHSPSCYSIDSSVSQRSHFDLYFQTNLYLFYCRG